MSVCSLLEIEILAEIEALCRADEAVACAGEVYLMAVIVDVEVRLQSVDSGGDAYGLAVVIYLEHKGHGIETGGDAEILGVDHESAVFSLHERAGELFSIGGEESAVGYTLNLEGAAYGEALIGEAEGEGVGIGSLGHRNFFAVDDYGVQGILDDDISTKLTAAAKEVANRF